MARPEREIIIEDAIGETRAAVQESGRTAELYLRRHSASALPAPGDIFAGRIRSLNRDMAAAFVDIGTGALGILQLASLPKLTEGQLVEVSIVRESEPGKGPLLSFIAKRESGQPGRIKALGLREYLTAQYPDAPIRSGTLNEFAAASETEIKLPGGGFLYIESTRAGHVIDVDAAASNKKVAAFEAAGAIPAHLRLRGIGGIVFIDFPNLRRPADRHKLWTTLRDACAVQCAKTKVAPLSPFCTAVLTRPRRGPSIAQIRGANPAETTAILALRRLEYEAQIDRGARLVLEVPPAAYAWLSAGHIPWQEQLSARIGARFTLRQGTQISVFIA